MVDPLQVTLYRCEQLSEWGNALIDRNRNSQVKGWSAVAAPDVLTGGDSTAWQSLFNDREKPGWIELDEKLHLGVSIRSYRCLAITQWVNALLVGKTRNARDVAKNSEDFPVVFTRSLETARDWLRKNTRGTRRCGLVASSGARRLRAEGLGVSLSATELADVANWYLLPPGDIRSSYALEVTANEYTCQGLELDYVGVCWGADLIWRNGLEDWECKKLNGSKWQSVHNEDMQLWIRNKYRVLLTRARLGTVVWVPHGDLADSTRDPRVLNDIANVLSAAGLQEL